MRTSNIGWLIVIGSVAGIICLAAGLLNGQTPTTNPAPAANAPPSKSPATRPAGTHDAAKAGQPTSRPADAKQLGGEPESIVQVANLIYAGTKSSKCFSDHFLVIAEKESAISTSRRFHAVKLDSEELFAFPLVIMTGEGDFALTPKERDNLKCFIDRGGFLLASAGCSSAEWDKSLRGELTRIFPQTPLQQIGMDHPIFHTVYEITSLQAKQAPPSRWRASPSTATWACSIRARASTTPPMPRAAVAAAATRSPTR
jgi:hypothetical protein